MTPFHTPLPLVDELTDLGIDYELMPHTRTTTAAAEARALRLAPDQVAKTIVLSTRRGHARALIGAADRLDLDKVRKLLGDETAELSTEHALAEDYPEFELGAVPPVGGVRHDRLVVDMRVAACDTVVFEAGAHDCSLRVSADDLVTSEGALVGDICAD